VEPDRDPWNDWQNIPYYDEKNPKNSRLLILEKEYQKFGLQQPDSLKNMMQSLNKD
jgi:hypothetical protein